MARRAKPLVATGKETDVTLRNGSAPARRHVLLMTAAALAPLGGGAARADDELPLKTDAGEPLANFRVPSELGGDGLPGIVWAGAGNPDVTLVEFFDYNCPYCRLAAKDMEALVRRADYLRLGLVNNAIISPGSVQAAKVHLAVLGLHGQRIAWAFHLRLLDRRGQTDGETALALAEAMKLDRARIEHEADTPATAATLRAQTALAASIGFDATPSFLIEGVGILGYPGPKSTAAMVAAVKRCDRLVCR
jgi:protein-disulfide isomerase